MLQYITSSIVITSEGEVPEHTEKKGAAMRVSIRIWRFVLTINLKFLW